MVQAVGQSGPKQSRAQVVRVVIPAPVLVATVTVVVPVVSRWPVVSRVRVVMVTLLIVMTTRVFTMVLAASQGDGGAGNQ